MMWGSSQVRYASERLDKDWRSDQKEMFTKLKKGWLKI